MIAFDPPDLVACGRRASACKAFRWMPGMRAIEHVGTGQSYRVIEEISGVLVAVLEDYVVDLDEDAYSCWKIAELSNPVPDFSDPATRGCLPTLVRQAYDCEVISCSYRPGTPALALDHPEYVPPHWFVEGDEGPRLVPQVVPYGATEVEAWLVALEGVP